MHRAAIVLTLFAAACASPSGPAWATYAAQADEAGLWIATESALLVVPGNLLPRQTPEETATDAASVAWDPFDPNECVRATVDGPTVTYALDDCAGSFGLVHASGHLAVTYLASPDPRTTVFDATTSDLVLNGGAVSFSAHATVVYADSAMERSIELTIDSQGVGPAGTAFTRHGTQSGHWFDTWGCLFVDSGHDTIGAAGQSWDMSSSALSYCVGECPMMGGAVTWTGVPGAVRLDYGGMDSASWSVIDQTETGSLTITCQP